MENMGTEVLDNIASGGHKQVLGKQVLENIATEGQKYWRTWILGNTGTYRCWS